MCFDMPIIIQLITGFLLVKLCVPRIHIAHSYYKFYHRNGPRDIFIQIDMTLNYMFDLGPPGTCFYTSLNNPL